MAAPRPVSVCSARLRRRLGLLVLGLPTASTVALDVALRGRELVTSGRFLPYAGAILLSLICWMGLLRAVSRRRGLVPIAASSLAVVLATTAGLTQATAFGQFHAYADPFAMEMGVGLLGTVVDPLGAQLPRALRAIAIAAVIVVATLALARGLGRAKVRESRFCLALALASFTAQIALLPRIGLPSQAGPPDVLFVAAVGKAILVGPAQAPTRPEERDWAAIARRTPDRVPKLTRAANAPDRSVLLILTESVRADAVCSAHVDACATTPATNLVVPDRLPLLGMHASGTFTAVAFASLTTGLLGTASREQYQRAPLIWDYAHAAGYETAYLSAQHATFAGAGEWLHGAAIDRHLHAESIDREAPQIPGADDRLLLRRATQELAAMRPPFFAVVHLASTHYPYVVDPARTPFSPMSTVSSAETAEALHNRYRNSVFMQDRALAQFIELFRRTDAGKQTVILFTSDHGESFFEHDVGLHGSTLFEEEMHVPAWIDAPKGVLRDDERAALERPRVRDGLTMNVDLVPTMLDLLGIWRAPEMAETRVRMDGRSLLGAEATEERTVVTTNCSALWRCGIPQWVAMSGRRKLIERNGVPSCYDTIDDPREQRPLDAAACAHLATSLKAAQKGR